MNDQVAQCYEEYADEYGPYGTPQSAGSSTGKPSSTGDEFAPSMGSYGGPGGPTDKKRILIVGLPRSGKSSIQSVIFHKVSPHETLFLETTDRVIKHDIGNSAFCQFQIWDVPGLINSSTDASLTSVLGCCSALIFIVDVTSEDTEEALQRLHQTISRAYMANPDIFIEVFIHKADALTDDQKSHCQRELQDRVDDELREVNLEQVINRTSYRTTSIFDHSIYDAFSQVAQKLIPQINVLENLLDFLVNNSGMEKAFLFDVISKLYVATDSTPVHPQDFELCSDMIEVIIDIGCIYEDNESDEKESKPRISTEGYDPNSSAIIRLNNNMVLYLREVSKYLALVCILRSETFDSNLGLIEYNVDIFREGLSRVITHQKK